MNKYQRITLIGIGLVIGLVQIGSIVEHGLDENRGWAVALLISAALLFVGFGGWGGLNLHLLKSILPGQRNTNTENATSPEAENEGLKSYIAENLRIINAFTDQLSKELFVEAEGVQTNRGSLASAMSFLIRSTLLLYAFSLLTVAKLRHNAGYFRSPEYKKTKELIVLQAFSAELRDMNIKPKDPVGMKLLSGAVDDMKHLEDAITDFFNQLSQGNTKSPASKINAWLKSQAGFQDGNPIFKGKSLDAFTKENLRVIYDMVFKLPVS